MGAPDASPRQWCVLVVEDEPVLRMLLADHLRRTGFKVLEADNARDAMAFMDSQLPVDLVFSDINLLGGMDGQALSNWLRLVHPKLPVILCSGGPRISFPDAPHDRRFLSKPYTLEAVELEIRELLNDVEDGA
ncbi:MAG TPA: response regulator [Steroidobacteraceae bacterium]|nr:response regulator [Steroidobacteraceae bacterium]